MPPRCKVKRRSKATDKIAERLEALDEDRKSSKPPTLLRKRLPTKRQAEDKELVANTVKAERERYQTIQDADSVYRGRQARRPH